MRQSDPDQHMSNAFDAPFSAIKEATVTTPSTKRNAIRVLLPIRISLMRG